MAAILFGSLGFVDMLGLLFQGRSDGVNHVLLTKARVPQELIHSKFIPNQLLNGDYKQGEETPLTRKSVLW